MTSRDIRLPRRTAIRAALACCLIPATRGLGAPTSANLEYAIKATFLLKFPAFVTWHDPLPANAFNVCVMGRNPFHGLLRQAAIGQSLEQRPVVVHVLDTGATTENCQVMFVTGTDTQAVATELHSLRGTPVLTVTDGQTDLAAKGVINFVLVDERVRFEVNLRAATANHLSISSKLLSIALRVYGSA